MKKLLLALSLILMASVAFAGPQGFFYASDPNNITGDFTLTGFSNGSVLFTNASAVVSEDNTNLVWDDNTDILSVKTLNINSSIAIANVIDDDTMATATDTSLSTSESIKAYHDDNAGGGGIRDLSRGLTIDRPSASTIDIDADQVLTMQTTDVLVVNSVNLTLDITASGAGGLDTDSEVVDLWYYAWVITNSSGVINGIISNSSTAPTMPAGYTHKGLVGAVYNDLSGNLLSFKQRGSVVFYDPRVVVWDTAAMTVSAWTSLPLISNSVPPIANKAHVWIFTTSKGVGLSAYAGGDGGVYSIADSATARNLGGFLPGNFSMSAGGVIPYEGSTIYYFNDTATGVIICTGFELADRGYNTN
jgi:hypothetical protein